MNEPAQTFTSPVVAVTTTATVSTANFMGITIPEIINIATVIYLVLLISHKGWQMYKEWKEEHERKSR